MAESIATKKVLSTALKELMKEQPLPKISIGEICKKSNMNRKSFYYHFKDKEDLIRWIFDAEFTEYYEKIGEESIWSMVNALVQYLYTNKAFYKKVLKIDGQNSFSEYLYRWCDLMLKHAIEKEQGKMMTKLQASFFVDGFICTIRRWLVSNNPMPATELFMQIKACFYTGGSSSNAK